MASNQDARPFVDLQKDSEEFVAKFEEDIAEFKTILDSKITSLICEPDSFGNRGSYEKNPLIEFSKAKYAIFITMKSLVNEREKEWIKYLNEMKKLFLENVEIFLAGTKLEVKLPASESLSVPATKKSPGNRKSTSLLTNSLYPMLSNFTKNIPALSSSLQNKGVHSSEPEETETMFSPRKMSTFQSGIDKMETDEFEMDLNKSRSSSRSRRSAKLDTSDLNASWTPSKEKKKSKEINESNSDEISKVQGRGNKIRSAAQNKKSKAKGVQKKVSGPESQEEASEFESGAQASSTESQEEDELESEKITPTLLKGRGRRGKKTAVDKNTGKITTSAESEELSEVDQAGPTQIKSRKSVRETLRSTRTAVSKMSGQSSSEDNDKLQETEVTTIIPPLKGRKGKQVLKPKEKENAVSKMSGQSSSEDNEKLQETEVTTIIPPLKGRKGKQVLKPREKENAVTKMSEQSSSEENEKLRETEINTNMPTVRGRRGKQAATTKDKEKENVFKPENEVDEAEYKEELKAPLDIPAPRKGRSAAAKTFLKPSDPPLVSNSRRGRSTTKEEGKATRVSRKPAGRRTLNERISESDTSVSPVRVILPVEENIDDDLDVYTPVARPTKSSARRKTLLPNMDETASGAADIVKGNSTRGKSKRKTISGVSDLESVAPSKRLKVGSSQMSNAVVEEEEAGGDDNLLDQNDSYSDWIVLKNVDGKIPTGAAIYEVKVWRAKKSAYIGSCESLRQKLTLHKLKQNSGHKHLDKFIERNYNDIQVRFEVVASLNDAKAEVKNRINNFVAQHKTTPAYN